MMEEDLVLKKPRSLKNYIVAGEWRSEIPFLSGKCLAMIPVTAKYKNVCLAMTKKESVFIPDKTLPY